MRRLSLVALSPSEYIYRYIHIMHFTTLLIFVCRWFVRFTRRIFMCIYISILEDARKWALQPDLSARNWVFMQIKRDGRDIPHKKIVALLRFLHVLKGNTITWLTYINYASMVWNEKKIPIPHFWSETGDYTVYSARPLLHIRKSRDIPSSDGE